MIRVKDKTFTPFIKEGDLRDRVGLLGRQITRDYQGTFPLMIGVMNGAFMFLSDLCRHIDLDLEIIFIKLSSYESTSSTGEIKTHLGIDADLTGREVIIVEDIVDTGLTMSHILTSVKEKGAKSVEVASLLVKPDAVTKDISIKYTGFEIPNKFVIGYGLDYDGYGRNLKEIYQLL